MISFGGSKGKRTLCEQNVIESCIGSQGTLQIIPFQHFAMGRVLALIPTATLALPAQLPVLPGGVAVPEGGTVSHGEPEWLGWGWAGNSRVLSAAGG